MRKKFILSGLIGLAILVMLLIRLLSNETSNPVNSEELRGVTGEPQDITIDFYDAWLDARKSTSSNPYTLGLVNTQALSAALVNKLNQTEKTFNENGFDPVLCQTEVPEAFRSKIIFENDQEVQIMILPKGKGVGVQSVVSLKSHNEFWEISDIACSSGEQAPDQGEFSFEREGFLLKQSIKPPLDNNYWHLIFEQDNVLGHTVPLFIDGGICQINGGLEENCSDKVLGETMKVIVKGDMTEAGVNVKKIELVK